MPASNGGTPSPLNIALYPLAANGLLFLTSWIFQFDPTNFNDANEQSFYYFKVEESIPGRVPTIRRVILSYRDLGQAAITIALNGIDGNTLQPISAFQAASIGTTGASQKICTQLIGITLSGLNLQLGILRAANAGPVSITKVRLEGTVEKTVY